MGTESPRPVRIATGSNRIDVHAEQRDDVSVEGNATTEPQDDEVRINATGALIVRVPEGTDVIVASASGRVTTHGRLGSVRVVGDAGRVVIDDARDADVRTTSARVEIRSVEAECTVRTSSGRVDVAQCGGATISTESGRIVVHGSTGPVTAHCVTGRVAVYMDTAADVVADAVSGRVAVRYPTGTRIRRVGGGADTSPIEEFGGDDCDCTVVARSVSGQVEVSTR